MSVLEYIEHYQRHIEKNISNHDRLYQCIRRLNRLHITPSLISESKVNETINRLIQFEGKLGEEATALSRKWNKREAKALAREKKNDISTNTQENKTDNKINQNFYNIFEEQQDCPFKISNQPIENEDHYRYMQRDFDEVLAKFEGENVHHEIDNMSSFSFDKKKSSTNDINENYDKLNKNNKTPNNRSTEAKADVFFSRDRNNAVDNNATERNDLYQTYNESNKNDKPPYRRWSEFKSDGFSFRDHNTVVKNFAERKETHQKYNRFNRIDKEPNRISSELKPLCFNSQDRHFNPVNSRERIDANYNYNKYLRNDKGPNRRWSEMKPNGFNVQERQRSTDNFTESMNTNHKSNKYNRNDKEPNRRSSELKSDNFNSIDSGGNFVNFTEGVDTNQNLNKYKGNIKVPQCRWYEIKSNGFIERVDINRNHNNYVQYNEVPNLTSSELHSHRCNSTERNSIANNFTKGSDTSNFINRSDGVPKSSPVLEKTNAPNRRLEEDLFLSSEEESYSKINPPAFKKVKKEEAPIVKNIFYSSTSVSESDKETISQNSYVGHSFEEALRIIESKQISEQAATNISTKLTQFKYVSSPSKSNSIMPQIETPPPDVSLDHILEKINRKSSQNGPLSFHSIPVSQELTEDKFIEYLIKSRNNRTKVYSGKNSIMSRPSSQELKIRKLQDHIDDIKYTNGIPSEILKPVLKIATPEQLFTFERHNPYLLNETDYLWEVHCRRYFKGHQRQHAESWRETYIRCKEQQAIKLRSVAKNIKLSQKEKMLSSARKTQLVKCSYKKCKY